MNRDFIEHYRGSSIAEEKLSNRLGLFWDTTVQDWDLINSNPNGIQDFLKVYGSLENDDEKFVLMQLIIASFAANNSKKDFDLNLWKQCSIILEKEHFLHIHTINYWFSRKEKGMQAFLSSLLKKVYEKVIYHYQ